MAVERKNDEKLSRPIRPHLQLLPAYAEFCRIDERFAMQSQRWSFFFVHDPERDFPGGIFGPAFNTIGRYDFVHAQVDRYALDGQTTAQEPVFAPRGTEAAEGAGWLWVLVNRHETMLNDLLIFDAGDLAGGLSVLKALRNALPHEKFI